MRACFGQGRGQRDGPRRSDSRGGTGTTKHRRELTVPRNGTPVSAPPDFHAQSADRDRARAAGGVFALLTSAHAAVASRLIRAMCLSRQRRRWPPRFRPKPTAAAAAAPSPSSQAHRMSSYPSCWRICLLWPPFWGTSCLCLAGDPRLSCRRLLVERRRQPEQHLPLRLRLLSAPEACVAFATNEHRRAEQANTRSTRWRSPKRQVGRTIWV